MNSYSQVGQDLWVLETLNYKNNGFFLDIGAFDGIKFSNSYLLEKNFNWTGILIEAHPVTFHQMIKVRNSLCLNYAISNENKTIYFETTDGTGSKISNMPTNLVVEAITLETLFNMYDVPKTIDYMSLDIEGYEYEALEKFPFNKYICSLITVEHNLYCNGDKNKNKIKDLLLNNNYKIIKENVTSENLPFEDWYAYDYN